MAITDENSNEKYKVQAKEMQDAVVILDSYSHISEKNRPPVTPDDVKDAHRKLAAILASLYCGDIDPWLGRTISVIIIKTATFIVFLDDTNTVQWFSNAPSDGDVVETIQSHITRIEYETLWMTDYPEKQKQLQAIRAQLAEAMALALSKSALKNCMRVIEGVENSLRIEADRFTRPKQLTTFIAIIAAMECYLYWLAPALMLSSEWRDWCAAGISGTFGAFISAVLRPNALNLNPASKAWGLMMESSARALVGFGAGVALFYTAHSGLVSPEIVKSSNGHWFVLLMAMSSGFSERMLPAIVNRAESLVIKSS